MVKLVSDLWVNLLKRYYIVSTRLCESRKSKSRYECSRLRRIRLGLLTIHWTCVESIDLSSFRLNLLNARLTAPPISNNKQLSVDLYVFLGLFFIFKNNIRFEYIFWWKSCLMLMFVCKYFVFDWSFLH